MIQVARPNVTGDPGPDRTRGTDGTSRRVKAEPNVRPHRADAPRRASPRHAAHFDVGIIPFLRNEFNRLCNPIKLQEYLALGFPIVATSLPAYERFEGLVSTAETHDEFLDCLTRALDDHDPDLARSRRRRPRQ